MYLQEVQENTGGNKLAFYILTLSLELCHLIWQQQFWAGSSLSAGWQKTPNLGRCVLALKEGITQIPVHKSVSWAV